MSGGSKSVSDADDDDDDDDDDIKDERQEDTHRDEGYLMEEVMTNTAQLVKQIARLRVVPHFSSGMVERAKRERAWKSPHARKGDTRRVAFSRVGWFSRALAFRLLALLSLKKNGELLVV